MSRGALELADDFRQGRRTVTEVVSELLERLHHLAPVVGGAAAIDPQRTLAEAEAADQRLRSGQGRVLEGVPFTVKDWIDAEGWPVSGETGRGPGAPGRRPSTDATAVARLRAAGAIVMAITTTQAGSPVHGPTRNPHDPTRAPGGTSAGAAVLVAAGVVPVALGSDSGGSIRLPAAWCGVAGLKPTFGRVPLTGHFPECGALEDGRTVIGPLARRVEDLAATLEVIAGPDGLDAGVAPVPLGDPSAVDLHTLRVGVVEGPAVDLAATGLSAAGVSLAEWPPGHLCDDALEITRRYWNRPRLTGAENVRLLEDWDAFRRRLLVSTAKVDALITPATESTAPTWRAPIDTDYRWLLPWSLTGSPVVAVPVDMEANLPTSVQVIGQPWQDHIALAVASCIESCVPGVPVQSPSWSRSNQ